jgi:magnesium chelatase family protein
MISKTYSATLFGIGAKIIEVEVGVNNGLPGTTIVGLVDSSIRESKERVRSAIKNSKYNYPVARVAINLAPANILKYGTQVDLAIAVGVLLASVQVRSVVGQIFLVGELALDGLIRPVKGVLSMVLAAKAEGFTKVVLPKSQLAEASLVEGIEVVGFDKFEEVLDYVSTGVCSECHVKTTNFSSIPVSYHHDFESIKGQSFAKRGLEIAVAGGHNILLSGSPGSGKTALASAARSILPDLDNKEFLETLQIYSVSTEGVENMRPSRPFRNPHTSISLPAFIGGGSLPIPGEISLAHNGVLFMDEFPEFSRQVLESLRQPLEQKEIKIRRFHGTFNFPANFLLIAAQNPCPCGYFGDLEKECACSAVQIESYKKKVSAPILDRIDIQIHVNRVGVGSLFDGVSEESSKAIARRVSECRSRQLNRNSGVLNNELDKAQVLNILESNSDIKSLVLQAQQKYYFSVRVMFKILKVARTLADLSGEEDVGVGHVAESLQYRMFN